MALTSDKKLVAGPAHKREQRTDRADAGTYFVGQSVQWDGALNIVKFASGSAGTTAAGAVIAGVVTKQQTVAQGGSLDYEAGYFAFQPGATLFTSPNQVAWLSTDTAASAAQGTNLLVLGRFKHHVSGSEDSRTLMIDVGSCPSGSNQVIGGQTLFTGK